jgi:hypothetical protein
LSGQAAGRPYQQEIEMENYEELVKNFQASIKEWQNKHDQIWKDLPEDIRLACADVIFRAIDQHAHEGGTFRQLIYERLGFLPERAYAVLQCAGALELSDNYDLAAASESREEKGKDRQE